MTTGQLTVLGSAVMGCAATIAFHLVSYGGAAKGPASRQSASLPGQASAGQPQPAPAAWQQPPDARKSEAAENRRISRSTAAGFQVHGAPAAGVPMDEDAWFANAERVAAEANRELESLRESLDLSPGQQRRVFDILARNSASWQPGMSTERWQGGPLMAAEDPATSSGANLAEAAAQPGDSSVSLVDALVDVLDHDQQQILIQEELDRRAWWEEILPQLLPPDFPDANDAGQYPAEMPGQGDTKAYQGPVEIFDD